MVTTVIGHIKPIHRDTIQCVQIAESIRADGRDMLRDMKMMNAAHTMAQICRDMLYRFAESD